MNIQANSLNQSGWLTSKLSDSVRVMSHRSGRGRPIYLRGWGRTMKVTIYRDNGQHDNFVSIEVATRFALAN